MTPITGKHLTALNTFALSFVVNATNNLRKNRGLLWLNVFYMGFFEIADFREHCFCRMGSAIL